LITIFVPINGKDVKAFIEPQYIPVCDYYGDGIHRMYHDARYIVRDKYTNEIISSLTEGFVCACGDHFVSYGDPTANQAIGDYAVSPDLIFIGSIGSTKEFLVDPAKVKHTSKTYLDGYYFYE